MDLEEEEVAYESLKESENDENDLLEVKTLKVCG